MRWDALFEDLESQFAEADRLALDAEVSERARAEMVGQELADRLRAVVGCRITVYLANGECLSGVLSYAGGEALVLDEEQHQLLIPYAAAVRYVGLGRLSQAEPSSLRRGIGLANALRGMARDRAELSVLMGSAGGTVRLAGVIDRVGRDYFDLAVLAPGEVRRNHQVSQLATIPFTAVAAIRSRRASEM
jgi:sRNA-binding regulator protein Hfq